MQTSVACWLAIITSASLLQTDAQLCYNQSTYIAPSFSYYQKLIYMSQHYTTACGFLLMSRCNRYRSVSSYTAALQTTYQIGYQTVTFCCPGYSGTPPVNCQDINECANNNGGCAQTCTNTAGSYQCSCGTGFTLNSDEHACDDIDECVQGANNCNQICHNTIGSYYCSCDPGYHLLNHQHICSDVDECSDGSLHMCTQHCNNTVGSHHCDCYVGYELQPDGITCTDINECVLGISGCDHNCTNNIGSFQCSCMIGYQLIHERNCIDINECDTSNGGCEHVCNNQIGSYQCTCRPGYTLESDLHHCSEHKTLLLSVSKSLHTFPTMTTSVDTVTSLPLSTEVLVGVVVGGVLLIALLIGGVMLITGLLLRNRAHTPSKTISPSVGRKTDTVFKHQMKKVVHRPLSVTNPVVVAMDEDQLYEQLPDGISNMSGCVAYGSHSFNGVDEKNKQNDQVPKMSDCVAYGIHSPDHNEEVYEDMKSEETYEDMKSEDIYDDTMYM